MPGLFGVVRLSSGATPPQDPRAIFDRMATILSHTDEDTVQRHFEHDDSMLIGRAGPPHLHHAPWPATNEVRDQARTFVAGVLHSRDALAADIGRTDYSLSTLRGSYCLARYEPSTRRLLLVADRIASFPLFYARVDGYLLFAPEIRALLAHPGLPRHLDVGGAATLLSSGHLVTDQTLLTSVRRIRGGEALHVEHGDCERRAYWRFAPGSRPGGATDLELEMEMGRLVRASTRRHLGNPEKAIIFLSGGADSRAILGAALELVGGQGDLLHAVSWGVHVGQPNSDVSIATRIAATMNLKHQFLPRSTEGYERHFLRANSLIGSASDVAAYHPLEYSFMGRLRHAGFERALRGDETMGWLTPVHTINEALKKVKLHGFGADPHLRDIIRAEHRDAWHAASEAVFAEVAAEVEGREPNDAKDYLYFTHRLQGYLNTASYYKLCVLDQRNVLLDDDILAFLELVPARLRIDKLLYRRAMARAFPELWELPFATSSNLEPWNKVLAEDRGVRQFIERSLKDSDSRVWEFIDRESVAHLFQSTSAQRVRSSNTNRARAMLRTGLLQLPAPMLAGAKGWRAAHMPLRLPAHAIIFRVLVLKQFVDELFPIPAQ